MTESIHEKQNDTSIEIASLPPDHYSSEEAPKSPDAKNKAAKSFGTTLAHSIFALVTSSFVLFELIFLVLFSNKDWFAINISSCCIPIAFLAMLIAHYLLSWLESPAGCRIFSFLCHGLPPVVYRNWIKENEDGFPSGVRFGVKTALWSAIDEAQLTFFGNLRLSSRATSGPPVYRTQKGKMVDQNPPMLILKIPFGAASKADQKQLVQTLLSKNPKCQLNEKLTRDLEKPEPPGSAMVLNIVSIALVLFFTDVSYSTLSYLEMLKDYYLSKQSSEERHDPKSAQSYFNSAEELRLHPLPISFVTQKMFRTASTKSGIMQTRAEAQWAMDKKSEAIASMRDSLEEHTKNFRAELKLARMLVETGNSAEAYRVLEAATDKAKKAFVPRLYYLALLKSKAKGSRATTKEYYDQSTETLEKELFKDVTDWPPGVSPYLPDVWHREDLDFIMSRLLDLKPQNKSIP
jgi:tetratricopeptide (TPR) repeat protein